jgi:plastocyanin
VALSTTSIALDDQGVHHIAWQRDVDLAYANNAEGEFVEVPLPPATAGGSRPRLAAAASVYLAWYSPTGTRLSMATYGEDEPLLAVPSPSAPPGDTDGGGACEPEGDAITLTAAALAWDKDCIAAEAGQPFSIEVVNNDSAPHNIGLYTEAPPAGEQLFQSPITGVPGGSAETFDVPPIDEAGEFYFQCDIHPTMSGTFVVAGK